MKAPLVLVSHVLCPYVQRVAIVLREKGIPFERRDIDLSNKPEWFLALSPTGKTPLLLVGDTPIFESSVICEYLEDTHAPALHPGDALERARHRAWMELASALLAALAGLYSAPTDAEHAERALAIRRLLERVETALTDGPFFAGARLSMVDAAFAPALRYFDVIEDEGRFGFFDGLRKLAAWRRNLAGRASVAEAVSPDYGERLRSFLVNRDTPLGRVLRAASLHAVA